MTIMGISVTGLTSGYDDQASNTCHCGSGEPFLACCGPILSGDRAAPTAEALMRARYSAYVANNVEFLGDSLHPEHRQDWDKNATRKWAEGANWMGLEVRSTEGGQRGDAKGQVEFVVSYKEHGQSMRHHEISRFAKFEDRWYYVDGDLPKPETRRVPDKIGRNEPCPCGSGKKYKKCCGR